MELFRSIAMDITNHCNARCKFCFNKWESPYEMEFSLYKKIILAAPNYVKKHILISCLFEPTLHKNFINFLKFLPQEFKHKFFLTTNLVKPFSDEFFTELSDVNIRNINISLETFSKELYGELTRTKNSEFYTNLKKITRAFNAAKSPPKLRFITMLLNDNYDELVDIAKRAHELYDIEMHEFRMPYPSIHIDKNYLLTQYLSKERVEAKKEELLALGYTNIYVETEPSRESFEKALKDHSYSSKPAKLIPLAQSFNADGTPTMVTAMSVGQKLFPRILANGHFFITGHDCAYDLNKIEDLDMFFRNILTETVTKARPQI